MKQLSILNNYLLLTIKNSIKLLKKLDKKEQNIEDLHNFRLNIRKIRSLLNLFFKDKKSINLKLKKIFLKTNSLREFDIFIKTLSKDKYPNLHKKIILERKKYLKKYWNKKSTKKYLKKLKRIKNKISKIKYSYSNQELIKITHNHFEESIDLAKKIDAKYSNKKLHKIRIHFKKSRYSLEFLENCHISNEKNKIKICKKVQNNFGEIQDIRNQIGYLKKSKIKKCSKKECKKLLKNKKDELNKLKSNIYE
ncbi:MAG: CHAD domain-containing protein [Arcobacter sp.]|uniref:CHAD domain-containing protein n=1 Tax=Arcobacter defluvii TaxID=873191 RepID=A0AAE7BEU9_9BACT|nr:CHAD domain-containing protein [Arcobacter defluvii]QKF76427.1 CHAD domain-containing protein [Arcobacter defluvii]RXI34576.1 hypothetical protein CP964_00320 [Arcobacter defluvii]